MSQRFVALSARSDQRPLDRPLPSIEAVEAPFEVGHRRRGPLFELTDGCFGVPEPLVAARERRDPRLERAQDRRDTRRFDRRLLDRLPLRVEVADAPFELGRRFGSALFQLSDGVPGVP